MHASSLKFLTFQPEGLEAVLRKMRYCLHENHYLITGGTVSCHFFLSRYSTPFLIFPSTFCSPLSFSRLQETTDWLVGPQSRLGLQQTYKTAAGEKVSGRYASIPKTGRLAGLITDYWFVHCLPEIMRKVKQFSWALNFTKIYPSRWHNLSPTLKIIQGDFF